MGFSGARGPFGSWSSSNPCQELTRMGLEASPAPSSPPAVSHPQKRHSAPSPTCCQRRQASTRIAFFRLAPDLSSCGWVTPHLAGGPAEKPSLRPGSPPVKQTSPCHNQRAPFSRTKHLTLDSRTPPWHCLWAPLALWRNTGRTLDLDAVLGDPCLTGERDGHW